ncbi:hypothetical protein IJ425_07965 [bacterium]|nr:hypothetical protein [bacterium]
MNTSSINSVLVSNKQMYQKMSDTNGFSNKTYLLNACKTDELQLSKEEYKKSLEKKEKNKKYKTIAGITAAIASIIGFIYGKKYIQKNGFDLRKLGFSDELAQTIETKGKNIFNKTINVLTNAASLRDDGIRRIVEATDGTPFGFIKKGTDGLTNLYNNWTKSGAKKGFANAKKALEETANLPSNIKAKLANFDEMFDDIDASTKKALREKGSTITQELLGKTPDGKRKTFGKMFEEMSSTVLADDKISNVYKKYIIDLTPEQMADESLAKKVKEYNTIITNGIERMRDNNIGNPASDAGGIIVALGGLGGALATSADKEERKSTAVNLGIPVLTTVGSIIYGSAKSIGGFKSMVFGTVIGMIGSAITKQVDKVMKKNKNLEIKA